MTCICAAIYLDIDIDMLGLFVIIGNTVAQLLVLDITGYLFSWVSYCFVSILIFSRDMWSLDLHSSWTLVWLMTNVCWFIIWHARDNVWWTSTGRLPLISGVRQAYTIDHVCLSLTSLDAFSCKLAQFWNHSFREVPCFAFVKHDLCSYSFHTSHTHKVIM